MTALRVSVVAMVLLASAAPVVATATGVRDDVIVNGDEAVAALLPVEFSRGAPTVLFPGNAYQGVLEVPAYAAIWLLRGPDLLLLRLFHQAVWVGALAVWFVAALEPARRSGRVSDRAYWWSAFAVAGLLGITSVVGWPVWFRVYPGYQLGALLGGLAVLVAVRPGAQRHLRWWFVVGVLAGAAVYAQPMHAAAVAVVLCLAASAGRSGVVRRIATTTCGVVVGVGPLLIWNLRNGMATLDPGAGPSIEHPEWGYPQRLVGVLRTSGRVLSGGDQVSVGRAVQVGALVGALALAVISVAGVVALVRWRGASRVLLLVPVLTLFGLPVLRVMSLQVDPRYAVGWWPGLVVLVAAGAAAAVDLERPPRAVVPALLVALVVVHLVVVGAGTRAALTERSDRVAPAEVVDAVDATADLVADLGRCGVDAVWGNYWAVYPLEWASDAQLRGTVSWGPERLTTLRPTGVGSLDRVAVAVPDVMEDVAASAALATDGTGRGGGGWISVVDPESGMRLAIERTGEELPVGCLGAGGLEPLPGS